MDKIEKFLRKIDRKRRAHVFQVLALLQKNELNTLDIKPLKGLPQHFRCRAGDIRILFMRLAEKNVVYDVNFRGNIYKQ